MAASVTARFAGTEGAGVLSGAALVGCGVFPHVQQRVRHADGVPLAAVRTPDGRTDARRVGRADHHGAGSVAQQEGDGALGVVDDVGELFGADHEHILRGAGTDQRIALGNAVAVAGAGGGDVEGGSRRRAEAVREACGR